MKLQTCIYLLARYKQQKWVSVNLIGKIYYPPIWGLEFKSCLHQKSIGANATCWNSIISKKKSYISSRANKKKKRLTRKFHLSQPNQPQDPYHNKREPCEIKRDPSFLI